MADPMNVLAPNMMGDSNVNHGLESLTANRGLGIDQIRRPNQPDVAEKHKNKLRVAKAREIGVTKDKVGI